MAAIVSLLVILTLSLIITRISTVALVHTGLSREAAQFQSRSAFTGVGFTTSESESVVNHPVRRRVLMILMLLGNAGIVSAVASLLLTFLDRGPSAAPLWTRLSILGAGVAVLWLLASSELVDRWMSRWITRALEKWTDIEVRDYASLLHLAENHQISELNVKESDWLAGRTLAELGLAEEGTMVIGIQRGNGRFVGAPFGRTRVEAGDRLLLYGLDVALKDLDQRCCGPEGDAAHRKAVEEQAARVRAEQARDSRSA